MSTNLTTIQKSDRIQDSDNFKKLSYILEKLRVSRKEF